MKSLKKKWEEGKIRAITKRVKHEHVFKGLGELFSTARGMTTANVRKKDEMLSIDRQTFQTGEQRPHEGRKHALF